MEKPVDDIIDLDDEEEEIDDVEEEVSSSNFAYFINNCFKKKKCPWNCRCRISNCRFSFDKVLQRSKTDHYLELSKKLLRLNLDS